MKLLTQKYLKASDLLEQRIKAYETAVDKEAAFNAFIKAAEALMPLMDFERVGILLLEHDLYDLFLDAFLSITRKGEENPGEGKLIASVFTAALK